MGAIRAYDVKSRAGSIERHVFEAVEVGDVIDVCPTQIANTVVAVTDAIVSDPDMLCQRKLHARTSAKDAKDVVI